MSAGDEFAEAAALGLPEGWRFRVYAEGKIKCYFSPAGHKCTLREVIAELGYTPHGLKKRESPSEAAVAAAKSTGSPHEAAAVLGLPSGWQVSSTLNSGRSIPVFISAQGERINSMKKLEEALGVLPAPLNGLDQQVGDVVPSSEDRRNVPLENVTHDGNTQVASSANGEHHSESCTWKRKRQHDVDTMAAEPHKSNATEALYNALRKVVGRVSARTIVLSALEVTNTREEAAEAIGFPTGWGVSKNVRQDDTIDLYYHPPGMARLRSVTEVNKVLEKKSPSMLQPGWTVPSASTSTAPSSPTSVACSWGEEAPNVGGYVLIELSDNKWAWAILPDDVTSIDLDAISGRVKASGWATISQSELSRTFRSDVDMVLYDSGRVEISAASKDVATRVARLLVGSWLACAEGS